MDNYRFFILLGALTALLFGVPVMGEIGPRATPAVSRLVVTGLFVVMLLSAVVAVGRTRWTGGIAATLAVPVVLLEVLRSLAEGVGLELATYTFEIVFLAYAMAVIVRFLFVTDRVTANTICAAVCVYLLLGVFWAVVLSTVEALDSGSFRASTEAAPPVIRFGGDRSVDALYFSFVALTTLGFGDIAPVSPLAKMLVSLEALVGQLFLAVLVARLVGLHITYSRSDRPRDGDP